MTKMTSQLEYVIKEEENFSLISKVKVGFYHIQEKSSLKSQKFIIPGIDASW